MINLKDLNDRHIPIYRDIITKNNVFIRIFFLNEARISCSESCKTWQQKYPKEMEFNLTTDRAVLVLHT